MGLGTIASAQYYGDGRGPLNSRRVQKLILFASWTRFLFCVDLIHTCNYRYVFLYVYIDDVLEVKDWTQRDG